MAEWWFFGARATKKLRGFSLHLSFFWLVLHVFFVKLGLLSNLDIDIVTSTWPFWQMSSLLHHALFKKSHNFTNSWKTEGKTKPKFQCTLTPLYYCILHLHKKNLITTKCHHGKSDKKCCENHFGTYVENGFSNGEGPTISAHEGIALFTPPHGLATNPHTPLASYFNECISTLGGLPIGFELYPYISQKNTLEVFNMDTETDGLEHIPFKYGRFRNHPKHSIYGLIIYRHLPENIS